MSSLNLALKSFLAAWFFAGALACLPARAQKKEDAQAQLPPELRGAKVYHLPGELKPGSIVDNLVVYKDLKFDTIDTERLSLNLSLSVKPMERNATIQKIYFQDVRLSGIPVHIETFGQEFKISKKDVVDLPAPLKCSIVFADLESLKPLREIVEKNKVRLTGRTFIDVRLNALEKFALRAKQVVLPVEMNEEVPLQMFIENSLVQMAAMHVLDLLTDPNSEAAIALAKEHVARLMRDRTLESLGRASVYLIYCEYVLRNSGTQAAEKFSDFGTGFIVGAEGKLLTAKRVVQPWKFDPQIAFLVSQYHLELDSKSYRVLAWPAGARALAPDGQPDSQSALSTENQRLRVLKTAPDRMEARDYTDPESGKSAALSLHQAGENDLALLQLSGANFQALPLAEAANDTGQDMKAALLGFPFGLSRAQTSLELVLVSASKQGAVIHLDHQLNLGESGAPLVSLEGRVVGIASGSDQCVPIGASRALIK